ncbi:NAD(P)/FAD-dependent oxidoreductase [Parahaliea aestuarii]|uniref:FAD-binding oxidoreductase n=1 Tax=Parahaliea aestuarii TaxID=1852021 RepID=A0A5C8ZVK0_9GAMM|nr:FAD-dependent oxidoreductase [Parahaliea aestuarii]TXS92476.1 FAD-binding oxidoreductase [Parahaliea aestuarii]
MKRADVIIVGAGIIGLSTAWQLARRSKLRILVLEKGAGTGEGSTGASSAVCRTRYSLDNMIQLARDGIAAYRHWPDFTGLSAPRAAFAEDGVLWMPGADRDWAEREHRRMQGAGVATEVFGDDELQRRYPAFSACTIAPDTETGEAHSCRGGGRYLLETEGGYMDPVACADDLLEACRGAGVDVRFGAEVAAVSQAGGAVTGLTLAGGEQVAAPVVINAAGPWCNRLIAAAGLALPWHLRPTRIQVLYLDRPAEVTGPIPVTVDMAAGIYFRCQNRGQQLVVGSVLESDEREQVDDPDAFNRSADDAFTHAKLHALHHRLPALPYRGPIRGYCGLYTVNEEDVHPLVGESELKGFYLANGFSGHGFKLAPAIGAMLARQISGERCVEFDTAVAPDLFRVDRQPIAIASKSVLA